MSSCYNLARYRRCLFFFSLIILTAVKKRVIKPLTRFAIAPARPIADRVAAIFTVLDVPAFHAPFNVVEHLVVDRVIRVFRPKALILGPFAAFPAEVSRDV